MATEKDAIELLDIETPAVRDDTGYYNGMEIKNCIDDGMSVLLATNSMFIAYNFTPCGQT